MRQRDLTEVDVADGPATHGRVTPSRRLESGDAMQIAVYTVVYAIAAFLGRLTVLPDTGISMTWPAAGVSVVWVLARAGRPWAFLDHTLIGVLTALSVLVTGGNGITAAAAGAAAAVQSLVCAAVIRWLCPEVWRNRGGRLQGRRELWSFIAAAAAGPAVSAPLLETESLLLGRDWGWDILLLWCARNIVSILVIAPLGFTIMEWVRRRVAREPLRRFSAVGWSVRAHPIEWFVLLLLCPAIYWYWFTELDHLNVVFPLLALACWSGARLPTGIVTLQGALVTTVIIATTIDGTGPFDDVGLPSFQIATAHVYIALMVVIGLALAAERDEREALVTAVSRSRRDAEAQAKLLETIIDSMSEGVRVVDPEGNTILRNHSARRLLLGAAADAPGADGVDDMMWVRELDGGPLPDLRVLFDSIPESGPDQRDFLVYPGGTDDERIVTFTAARLPAPAEGAVLVMRDVTAGRRELRRAAQVQEGLLPTELPDLPGYDLAARFVPAGSVGGDFYDWHTVQDGIVLTLADVMGKGMGAAILAATTRSLLGAHGPDADVVQPLVEAERSIARDLDNAGAFVTLFRSFVHTPTGAVTYIDAGHGLAAVLTRDGSARRLPANGLPLGIVPDEERTYATEQIRPGETLLVVSDGVLDAVGGSLEDLADVWSELPRGGSAAEVVEAVVARAVEGAPEDDLTVLALHRHA
ncbi:SpoIIE family protein phosphatase [Microbacterium rhizophilus]|uniref:SpoIIE family protein phosphatase n=1 Tax=Microbacterium rhizophilus TaxID=3138934 RepID=UPI0031F0A3AD